MGEALPLSVCWSQANRKVVCIREVGEEYPKKETGEKQQARLVSVVPSKFQQWKSLVI